MTITKKIGLGFAIPVVLLVFVGVLARLVSTRLATTTDWVEHSMEVEVTMQKALTRVVDAETGTRGFLLTGDEPFLEPYVSAQADVASLFERAAALTTDNADQHRRVEAARNSSAVRLSGLAVAVEQRRHGALDEAATRSTLTTGKAAMDHLRSDFDAITSAEAGLLTDRRSAATTAIKTAELVFSVAIIGGILAALLASILIARSILAPIRNLREGVDRLATGDLKHRITTRAKDETGALAIAFNAMVERRKAAEEQAASLAEQRERLLEQVGEIASRLATAAEELHATTSSQASGAQQQSAAVAETTAIVEEVVQTSQQAAERAQQVSEIARDASDVGATGQEALGKATATMDNARDQANRVATSILSLAEQAQSIGEIITSVDDIAEQSNLLALNAALEAAHAGERGRGFAVVATEMKSLAEQSKAATVQVRRMLGAIQKQSNDAVLMTEASTRGLGEASSAAESVGQALRTLAESVASASQAVAQIAASARQQSGGLQQINQAMRDVAAVANQNLATTRQVGQAARDLTTLGITLRDSFGQRPSGRS
ncbi:MAG: methyl-accepting chemotaxis protein [Deltaproteobacteria bacterium]